MPTGRTVQQEAVSTTARIYAVYSGMVFLPSTKGRVCVKCFELLFAPLQQPSCGASSFVGGWA